MSEQEIVANSGRKSGLLNAFLSVAAAAFGVQSNKNREKDFSHSSPWPYILGGLVFTAIFITILVVVVKVAIS